MIKAIIVALLAISASAYNATIAHKLAVAASICYENAQTIEKWSCKACTELPLKNVKTFSYRLNLLPETFLTFLDTLGFPRKKMLSSLLLEEPSISKIGSPTWMLNRSIILDAVDV